MLYKCKGIVLKTIRYGESSLIAHIYTELYGLQSFIINGVRKAKSRMPMALFQVFTELEIVMYYRESKDMQRLNEARPEPIRTGILTNPLNATCAQFLAEVLDRALEQGHTDRDLFDFITLMAERLNAEKVGYEFLIRQLIELSGALGFGPDLTDFSEGQSLSLTEGKLLRRSSDLGNEYELSLGETRNLASLLREDVKLSRAEAQTLLLRLLDYFRYHIQGFKNPKSQQVLFKIL